MHDLTILQGDCRELAATLAPQSVQCIVTSPPYFGLRSYLDADDPLKAQEIGTEATPDAYVQHLVDVFRALRPALRDDGTLWLNLGDSYWGSGQAYGDTRTSNKGQQGSRQRQTPVWSADVGIKDKDMIGIPWTVALALRADGWYLRSDPSWLKRNGMPSSVQDRPGFTHEYLFLLSKRQHYYYDRHAVLVPSPASSIARVKQPPCNQQTGGEQHAAYAAISGNLDARNTIEHDAKHPETRNRRTTDWSFESIDLLIDEQRAYLAHLEHVREHGGMLASPDGDPLAMLANPTTYKGSHYATFPPTLVEPCILASTSPRACEHCGAPWERVVERTDRPAVYNGSRFDRGKTDVYGLGRAQRGERYETVATGWHPSCACEHNTGAGRCIVLDPFGGTGTAGMVARKHGRRAILMELNAEYVQQAYDRTLTPIEAALLDRGIRV